MSIIYCEPRMAFFAIDRKKIPTALPLEKALRRHERRQGYEAVIGEPIHPEYVVCLYPNAASIQNDSVSRCKEGNGDWVSVYFLDTQLRWYLRYGFQERQPGRLFLNHAVFREFAAETDDVLLTKTFAFKEDGHILMEHSVNGTFEEREATFSVAENWEDYPVFGGYASLCREQRVKES